LHSSSSFLNNKFHKTLCLNLESSPSPPCHSHRSSNLLHHCYASISIADLPCASTSTSQKTSMPSIFKITLFPKHFIVTSLSLPQKHVPFCLKSCRFTIYNRQYTFLRAKIGCKSHFSCVCVCIIVHLAFFSLYHVQGHGHYNKNNQ